MKNLHKTLLVALLFSGLQSQSKGWTQSAAMKAAKIQEANKRLFSAETAKNIETAVADGADANNATDAYGNRALHSAACRNKPEVVKALVAAKADIEAKCAYNSTALFDAAAASAPDSFEALVRAGALNSCRNNSDWSTQCNEWFKFYTELIKKEAESQEANAAA